MTDSRADEIAVLDDLIAAAKTRVDLAKEALAPYKAEHDAAWADLHRLDEDRFAALIRDRDPADFWTDPDLRRTVSERSWRGGMGDANADQFITAAVKVQTDVPGMRGWDRRVDDATGTVTIVPTLMLGYRQDVAPVAAALLAILPAYQHDNADLHPHVLDRLCGKHGSISLLVTSADRAQVCVNGHPGKGVPLDDALTRLAERYWFEGGPVDDDDD
jgi:hypothetical protein